MKLTHILKQVEEEHHNGWIPIERWKINETDYLYDIGFRQNGDFSMEMEDPQMVVWKDKEKFYLKSQNKILDFKQFNNLIQYFDNYQHES